MNYNNGAAHSWNHLFCRCSFVALSVSFSSLFVLSVVIWWWESFELFLYHTLVPDPDGCDVDCWWYIFWINSRSHLLLRRDEKCTVKLDCIQMILGLLSSFACSMSSDGADLVMDSDYFTCDLQHEQVQMDHYQDVISCGGNQSCASCVAEPILSIDGTHDDQVPYSIPHNDDEEICKEVPAAAMDNTTDGMPWSMFAVCLVPYFVTLIFALPRTFIGSRTYIVSIIHRYSGINTLLLPLGLMVYEAVYQKHPHFFFYALAVLCISINCIYGGTFCFTSICMSIHKSNWLLSVLSQQCVSCGRFQQVSRTIFVWKWHQIGWEGRQEYTITV